MMIKDCGFNKTAAIDKNNTLIVLNAYQEYAIHALQVL